MVEGSKQVYFFFSLILNFPREKLPQYNALSESDKLDFLGEMNEKVMEPMAQVVQYVAARVENLTHTLDNLVENLHHSNVIRTDVTGHDISDDKVWLSSMVLEGTRCNSWEELRDKFAVADFVRQAEVVYCTLDHQNVVPYLMEKFLGPELM